MTWRTGSRCGTYPRVRKQARSRTLIAPAVLLLGTLIVAGCPRLFPDGLSTGSRAIYEGLVSVPEEGWEFASFTSSALLIENERLRSSGRQLGGTTCLQPRSAQRMFERPIARTPADADGYRTIWARFSASSRYATGACMARSASGRSMYKYGTYLEVDNVEIARPLGCGRWEFIMNHLRCPA